MRSFCESCGAAATTAILTRVGKIPEGYDRDPQKYPDRTTLRVRRFCESCRSSYPSKDSKRS